MSFSIPVITIVILIAGYVFLEFNRSQRKKLTHDQINFLNEAAKGNKSAENLVASCCGGCFSPREYAELRCRVDAIVSNKSIG